MRSAVREWVSRLAGAVGRGRGDRDLERELCAHLELAEEELRRQGHSPAEAARLARVQSGRSTQAMESLRDRRGIPPLSVFWLDAKLGGRMLRKHWALTLIGGLAMAAAMTLGSAVFNFVNVMLGTRVPLEEGDRIVIVQPYDPETRQQQNTPVEVFERWRGQMRSLSDVGAFRTVERDLAAGNGASAAATVAEMSAAGFALARIDPLMGRFLLPEDERPGAPPAIVIGFDAWQSTFASDPGVVGRPVQLDGVSHTVIGVMPAGFRFPMNHQYWTSLRAEPPDRVTVFARLGPGATIESAQAELGSVGFGESILESGLLTGSGQPPRPFVRPYIIGLIGERGVGIVALLPVVLPLLLIPPCTNIGALIYARTVARQGEFAARTALGASRGRIVTQIFLEVLVLAAGAAAVAAMLAPKVAEILSYMVVTYAQPFWMDFGVSYSTILFTAGLAVLAALIAGALPAMRATGEWQVAGLSALNRTTAPQLGRGWTAIVVVQVALSVAIVPTAVELAWNQLRPAILGPGFPVKEFLTARLDLPTSGDPAAAAERFAAVSAEVARRLGAEPGVSAVTMSESKPFSEQNRTVEAELSGSGPGPQSVGFNEVDAEFFDAFGIRLLAGRGFEPADNDPLGGAVLVNRSFANRVFAGENPVGRTVRVLNRNGPGIRYEIAGLVDNQFAYSDQATMYRPLTPSGESGASPARQVATKLKEVMSPGNPGREALSVHLAVRASPAMHSSFESRLREVASAIDPSLRVDDVEPLGDVYFFLSLPNYIFGSMPALVAMGVLLFATVGIYTRMSFAVVQRRREIGIRSALGASPARVVAGIFRSVFVPVSAAAAVGALAALLLDIYASPLLFGTSLGDRPLPWILPAAEAFILLIGVLAVSGPARRALRVDSVEALREG